MHNNPDTSEKYWLAVMGCQMNAADAEKINKLLQSAGWQKAQVAEEARLIIVVACSVRQSAAHKMYSMADKWQAKRRAGQLKAVLTGCVVPSDKQKLSALFDLIMPISDIGKLAELIESDSQTSAAGYFGLPAARSSKYSATVTISNGCDNFCSYCVVPYTRGREVSRPAAEIIEECRQLIGSGYKEIILLGQNVNSYRDASLEANEDISFPKLLAEIDELPGDYWIRFLSSHPKDLSPELLGVMAGGSHIAPNLHLALQSGDDQVLERMNRHYSAEHFLGLVGQARLALPVIGISTDIIVGFPGETVQQFENTAKAMQSARFDMAYISEYSPRSGTKAHGFLDDVSKEEKARRKAILDEIVKMTAQKNSQDCLGRTIRVLVDGWKNGKCYGRTAAGKIVTYEGDNSDIGTFKQVRIDRTKAFVLSGILA